MAGEIGDDPHFRKLVAEFALTPIRDDRSYQAALAVLDRLFALDARKTPAERQYFRELACIAHHYEQALLPIGPELQGDEMDRRPASVR